MDKLRAMTVFREVARQGSFTRASAQLSLATSAVSRYVAELERWLDTQLIYRTTRSISLTPAGRTYLDQMDEILQRVDRLELAVKQQQSTVSGILRITAPLYLGQKWLSPLAAEFMGKYPGVDISVFLTNRHVNMVEEGMDLALKIGRLKDSNFKYRTVSHTLVTCFASPLYLARHGTPKTPDDLKAHNCLYDSVVGPSKRWHMVDPASGRELSVAIDGRYEVNSGEMVKQAALDGMGIGYLPDLFIEEELGTGELLPVLEEYRQAAVPISLVYPQNWGVTPLLRTFVDAVVEQYGVV
ncbi:LysR family transcriptional regulator [Kistimonas asteriae]|uniref:LysR family transcriptional regulator n=1 Tax=Kistimonas asteriae TaxID=517724 RepID=UPI001BA53BAE|nr:LysR family transcriptional regulator [Kistimonas asteriae]